MAQKPDTHIRVSESTWKRINRRKEPGDSMNDVLGRVLDQHERQSTSE